MAVSFIICASNFKLRANTMVKIDSSKEIKVLIVDDIPKIRMMIRKMVEIYFSIKLKIYECTNGKEAVDAFNKYTPDWILMDIKMPVMDGLEASKIILDSNPEVKILIFTHYDDVEYYELAQKFGIKAFVLKENLSDIPVLIRSIL